MLPFSRYLLSAFIFLSWIGPAQAQSIDRTATLSFGEFALKDNNSPHTLSISILGVITASSAFVRIEDPVRGRYELTDFPIGTSLSIDIPDTTISLNGSGTGELFTLQLLHPGGFFNGGSPPSMPLGGTITTSGSGLMYPDGNYSGEIDITVNY